MRATTEAPLIVDQIGTSPAVDVPLHCAWSQTGKRAHGKRESGAGQHARRSQGKRASSSHVCWGCLWGAECSARDLLAASEVLQAGVDLS